jgi:hypothetical protein
MERVECVRDLGHRGERLGKSDSESELGVGAVTIMWRGYNCDSCGLDAAWGRACVLGLGLGIVAAAEAEQGGVQSEDHLVPFVLHPVRGLPPHW